MMPVTTSIFKGPTIGMADDGVLGLLDGAWLEEVVLDEVVFAASELGDGLGNGN